MPTSVPTKSTDDAVIAATTHWLTRAVIGLNLCPFARAVHQKGQIRYVVCRAETVPDVLDALREELDRLAATDPEVIDTTLLILPQALAEFHAFTHALTDAERVLKQRRLRGVIQIASFHPDFVFADAEPDDVENLTNRAPYPILHLLREDSVGRAVDALPDADRITERNQARLRELGHEGYAAWMARDPAD
ncbi:DUF1415 domain-containing protein [Achromobacter sp. GG226]|uniref:DUF1415 domain-containing protein n=1 Tax=Verticiella alkaliphila TaxID=2779529 RepID=UPI001C0AD00E|nr:DUF1415 domain-containing protein [Verticiella sp. GG226]MBU4610762.1 DUF1415 domain-containing protein [Verticiella sp. GG226]